VRLTEQQVRYVADLANLTLTTEEVHKLAHDLGGILEHIDKLNELDTTDVEPMAQVLYAAEETATLRHDRERPPLGSETALANAALPGAGYFKVPRVIDR
jgi:aspartyl-tRNA(Asn)/glutamyl-tRNA(Gln) amidotransferase subunit C